MATIKVLYGQEYVVNCVIQGVAYPHTPLVGWVGCYRGIMSIVYG